MGGVVYPSFAMWGEASDQASLAGVAQSVEHLFCKQAVAGSSPFASSSLNSCVISEGFPSGQREQTVNLPALAYGGSNPPPSTGYLDPRGRGPRV